MIRSVLLVIVMLAGACASGATTTQNAPSGPVPTSDVSGATQTTGPLSRPANRTVPLEVLLIGDSVTYELAPAIKAALESAGDAEVTELTQFGFALSLNELNNWRTTWPGVIRNTDPDVVLIQTGTWDIDDNLQAAGRVPSPADSDWEQSFSVLLDEATFVLTIAGAEVLWLSMLPGPDTAPSESMNAQVQRLADRNQHVSVIDVAAPLRSVDGGFIEVDNGAHLRKPDGVHLCVEGAMRATAVLVDAMAQRYGVDIDAEWDQGEWRDDGRYDLDPCADRAR